jgi:CBS domain-containing protein
MDNEGRFVKKFDKEDVMDVFDMVEGPVITAGDVAEAYDSGAETARRRLRELHADGRINKRKARKRVLWWRAEDEDSSDVADVLAGNDPETIFKLLSLNLGESITVGETVYENGSKHSIEE